MWVTKQISPNFQQEYATRFKTLDVRSDEHILEIFQSEDFEQITIINAKYLMFKKYLFIESELNAHLGICCHTNPKNALILESFNLELAYELLRHEDLNVDFVQNDKKILDSLISFLPNFTTTLQNPHFKHYHRVSELPMKKYEFIIYEGCPSQNELNWINQILSENGILTFMTTHPLWGFEDFKTNLLTVGEFFNIVMPYFIPLQILNDKSFIFASKYYHPLAGMLLQKIDMLEGLRYYNADIHEAAFALPYELFAKLKGILKN